MLEVLTCLFFIMLGIVFVCMSAFNIFDIMLSRDSVFWPLYFVTIVIVTMAYYLTWLAYTNAETNFVKTHIPASEFIINEGDSYISFLNKKTGEQYIREDLDTFKRLDKFDGFVHTDYKGWSFGQDNTQIKFRE